MKRSLLIRSFIFLPESAVMTPIGHIVVTCCLHKRSCKKSARCAQSDASQTAHRNAGAKCIYFLFPCFGSAAFGTLGWNTCHNLNSILHDIKVVPQKPGGDKPRRVNDYVMRPILYAERILATGRAWCSAQRIRNPYDCRWQSYIN